MRLHRPPPAPLRRLYNRIHINVRGRSRRDLLGVVWISAPRSGTTYLCDLLAAHPRFDAYPEIFHRQRVFAPDFQRVAAVLEQRHGLTFKGPDDPALIAFVHEHPRDFLEDLRSASAGRWLSFKLFPGQLDRAALRRVILADRNLAKVIFQRNPLDAYISRQKALQRNQWEFVDTSATRVRLSAEEFAQHLARLTRWYDSVRNYLADTQQPYSEFSYEELVAPPTEAERLRKVAERLETTFPELGDLTGECAASVSTGRRKQDTSPTLAGKIENYTEFSAGLVRLGLERFLGAASR